MVLVSVALLLLCLSATASAQNININLFPRVAGQLGQDFAATFSSSGAATTLTYIAGGPTFLSVAGSGAAVFTGAANNAWNAVGSNLFENNLLTSWRFAGQDETANGNLRVDPLTVDFSAMDTIRTVTWMVTSLATQGSSIPLGSPRYWYGGSGADSFNFASYTTATGAGSARANLLYTGDGDDAVVVALNNNVGTNAQDSVYAQAGNDFILLSPGTTIATSGKLADGGVGIDLISINVPCNSNGATPPSPTSAAIFLYQSAGIYLTPTTAPAAPIVDAPSGNQYFCFTAGTLPPAGTIPNINYNNVEFIQASIVDAANPQQVSFILQNPLVRNPSIRLTIIPSSTQGTVTLELKNASLVAPTTFAPLANTVFVQPATIVAYSVSQPANVELNAGAGSNDIEVTLLVPTAPTSVYLVVNGEATRSVIFNYPTTPAAPLLSTQYLIQEGVNTGTAWTTSTAVTNILRLTGNSFTSVSYGTLITYTPATHRSSYPRNPTNAAPGFVLSGGSGLSLDWSAIPIIYDLIPVVTRTYDFTKINVGSEDEMDLFLYLSYPGNNVALLKTSTGTQYFFTLSVLTTLNIRTQSCVTVIGDSSQFFNTPTAGSAVLIQLNLVQNSCCCTTRFPVPFCVQQPKSCFAPSVPTPPANPIINQV